MNPLALGVVVKSTKKKLITYPTDSQIHAVVIGALRKQFAWNSKNRYDCLQARKKVYYQTTKKNTQRRRVSYQCEICEKWVVSTKIRVDHIIPVVDPEQGFKDLNTFVQRLWCDIKNLQAICIDCHKLKTAQERKIRNKMRKGCTKNDSSIPKNVRRNRKSTKRDSN